MMRAGLSRLLAVITAAVSLVFVAACCVITCPSPCSAHDSHYAQSRTVVLPDGRPLARFDLTQTVNVDLGDDCPANDHPTGTVSLSITNMTGETISFGYLVTGYRANNTTVWTYNGPMTVLAAGATIDVGVIANSTVPLVVGLGPHVEVTGVSASSSTKTARTDRCSFRSSPPTQDRTRSRNSWMRARA